MATRSNIEVISTLLRHIKTVDVSTKRDFVNKNKSVIETDLLGAIHRLVTLLQMVCIVQVSKPHKKPVDVKVQNTITESSIVSKLQDNRRISGVTLQDIIAIQTTPTAISTDASIVSTDVSIVPTDVSTDVSIVSTDVSTDVSIVPTDVSTDVSIVSTDVSIVSTDVSTVPTDVSTTPTNASTPVSNASTPSSKSKRTKFKLEQLDKYSSASSPTSQLANQPTNQPENKGVSHSGQSAATVEMTSVSSVPTDTADHKDQVTHGDEQAVISNKSPTLIDEKHVDTTIPTGKLSWADESYVPRATAKLDEWEDASKIIREPEEWVDWKTIPSKKGKQKKSERWTEVDRKYPRNKPVPRNLEYSHKFKTVTSEGWFLYREEYENCSDPEVDKFLWAADKTTVADREIEIPRGWVEIFPLCYATHSRATYVYNYDRSSCKWIAYDLPLGHTIDSIKSLEPEEILRSRADPKAIRDNIFYFLKSKKTRNTQRSYSN